MKKLYTIALLLTITLTTHAQLSGSGYYRVRNAQNKGNYISMANDKFSYQFLFGGSADTNFGSAQQIGGGLSNLSSNTNTVKNLIFKGAEIFLKNDIHLVEDADCIDPATILYLQNNPNSSYYNIIGQGTSLLTLTTGSYKASVELIFNDIYATIKRSSGTGVNAIYDVSVNIAATDVENISYNSILFSIGKSTFMSQAKLGSYYFYDNNGTFSINNSNSADNAKWYIEPVTYFNVKADVEFNDKYYTTLCVPFAYTLSNNVLNAYAIKSIGADGKMEVEPIAANGGTVPAGTPVLLECSSNEASECKLQLTSAAPSFSSAVSKVQYAPLAAKPIDGGQSNLLKGAYFKNEDPTFDYQYNRSGTSTNAQITLQNFTAISNPQKYVLGITDSGKLGFVEATGTAMPANKAWIEYDGSAELVLPFTKPGDVNRDGFVDVADITAMVNIILNKDNTQPYTYDHDAAELDDNNGITVGDLTVLVNIILGGN